jgi:hypothetical protein
MVRISNLPKADEVFHAIANEIMRRHKDFGPIISIRQRQQSRDKDETDMCMFVRLIRSERHQHLISAFDGTWRSHMVGRQASAFQVCAVIAWSTNTKPNTDHRFSSSNCYRFEILRQFRDVSRPFNNNNSTLVEFGPPPYDQEEAQQQHRLWLDRFHDYLMHIPRRTRDVEVQTDVQTQANDAQVQTNIQDEGVDSFESVEERPAPATNDTDDDADPLEQPDDDTRSVITVIERQ